MKFYAYSVVIEDEWDEETDDVHVRGTVLLGNNLVFSDRYHRYATQDEVLYDFAARLRKALDVD